MSSPDAKKPCKGILKASSSFDKHSYQSTHRKSAKFDELNVLQTYHPPDKDYGHMKIEEPKTPYNYEDPDMIATDELDAEALAEKLRLAAQTSCRSPAGRRSSFGQDPDDVDGAAGLDDNSDDDDGFPESKEEKEHRVDFEKRRKAHYKEFEAVKLARKLIEEEEDDDDDGTEAAMDASKIVVISRDDPVNPVVQPMQTTSSSVPSE